MFANYDKIPVFYLISQWVLVDVVLSHPPDFLCNFSPVTIVK